MKYLPLKTLTEMELAEVIIRSVYSPVFVYEYDSPFEGEVIRVSFTLN